MRAAILAIACVLAAGAVAANAQATVDRLGISQALQFEDTEPVIRVYLNLPSRATAAPPRVDDLTATFGSHVLTTDRLRSFEAVGEGTALVFLVDISKSLSPAEFERIVAAIDEWLLRLEPQDRVAILAFGDQSFLVADFTSDRAELKAALDLLAPTADRTLLHQALSDGLELARRRDPDLPGRRALILLSDGRDEGSALTSEDVLATLRRDPAPVYAIGLSRLRDLAERRRYLDLLRRFAANSGGAFFAGDTASVEQTYASIRQAIRDVWVADFRCPDCPVDGAEYRLQVTFRDGDRVLSEGSQMRLLPSLVLPPAAAAPTAAAELAAADERTPATPAAGATGAAETGASGMRLALFAALALALGLLAAAAWRRRAGREPEGEPKARASAAPAPPPAAPRVASGAPPRPVAPSSFRTETGVETTRPPRAAQLRLIRLIVVRGDNPGKQYTVTLLDRAVVGTRSTCACVVREGAGFQAEQFEISQYDGQVYLRDLTPDQTTCVDGLPLEGRQILKSDSLVGTQSLILRIVFDETPVTRL